MTSAGKVVKTESSVSCNIFIKHVYSDKGLLRTLQKNENTEPYPFVIHYLTLDAKDDVFILNAIQDSPRRCRYRMLFCVSPNGQVKKRLLKFPPFGTDLCKISVGKDNKIVFFQYEDIYVCDNNDDAAELKEIVHFKCDPGVCVACLSDKNEIIISLVWSDVLVYTIEGDLINRFMIGCGFFDWSLAYDFVNNEILIGMENDDGYYLSRYSLSGYQLETLDLTKSFGHYWKLKSHPSGAVVLVRDFQVLYVQ